MNGTDGRRGRAPHRVCPWWMGYFLLAPWRRLAEDPDRILRPHLAAGMTALDVGCGMGYFTLPMARAVGPGGKVIAVDLQEKMIAGLTRRARRAGLGERVEARRFGERELQLGEALVDFTLAYHVVHEVRDATAFVAQLYAALKPGGALLMAEPAFHVAQPEFEAELEAAAAAGFARIDDPALRRSHGALLRKREGEGT